MTNEHTKRAVDAVIGDLLTNGDGAVDALTIGDLRRTVALVTRYVRDDIVMAYQRDDVRDVLDVEGLLNQRVAALEPDRYTITGDTTE